MPILTPEERLGLRIAGRYRMDSVLFTGGMGVLFRATDEATGIRVAVKMLKPVYAEDRDRVARFVRETRIARMVYHTNIATVLDVGQDETGVPFLVIELLEGRSLHEELEERRTLPLDEALGIVLPIAAALGAAHAAAVVHRDVKPANIFLCCDERGVVCPKLLDFGVAKSSDDDFETGTGLVVGTPGYMSPEQAQYGHSGPFTDVWALGAVLYRCLSGAAPHAGGSVPERFARLVREPVPPLVVDGVAKAVGATIDRALARDPHGRYATMEVFARALVAARDATLEDDEAETTQEVPALGRHAVATAAHEPPARRVRRTAFGWLAGSLAAGGLVASVLLVLRDARPEGLFDARPAVAHTAGAAQLEAARAERVRPPLVSPDPPKAAAVSPGNNNVHREFPVRVHPRASTESRLFVSKSKLAAPATRSVEQDSTTGLPVATEW